jgi:microcystin-dependent protein
MTDQFLGEIRIVSFNFAPVGWAACDGQILPISQNTALFSLVGTFYGGNGTSNFALPNLQGNVPVHQGQGAGLSSYVIGQPGGSSSVTLITSELPAHTHAAQFSNSAGTASSPAGNVWAKPPGGGHGQPAAENAYSTSSPGATMAGNALQPAGQGGAHNNMSPYLVLNFVIAMQGIFPSRG